MRFDNATKRNCLVNFLETFVFSYGNDDSDQFVLVADNVKDETLTWLIALLQEYSRPGQEKPPHIMISNTGSSAGSFRIVMEEALKLDDDEIVYFVEDDYAHLPNSRTVLLEGLERSHYVTLYNHPDKYIPATQGGNPLIGDDSAEPTKVFVTNSSYWMITNSTTMTFATRVQYLREDRDVWEKYTKESYPQDMRIFLELRAKKRFLVQPIPTMATHCEPAWAAHLHGTGIKDWNKWLKPQKPIEQPPIDSMHASF